MRIESLPDLRLVSPVEPKSQGEKRNSLHDAGQYILALKQNMKIWVEWE